MIARSLLGRTLFVTVLTVLVTHIATLFVFQRFYVAPLLEYTIQDRANHIFSLITALEYLSPTAQSAFIREFDDNEGGVIQSATPDPRRIRSPAPSSRIFLLQQRLQLRYPATRLWITTQGQLPTVWIPLHTTHGDFWYITQRQRFDADFPEKWALLLALVILLGFSSVYWAVYRINRPLRDLTQAAHCIASGQPSLLKITPDIPTEIREVSEAFHTMQHALKNLESNRTIMLAGVSHDLRTPLSRLRLALEMLQLAGPPALDPLIQDLEEIDRIIDQFLDFARDRPHYPLHLRTVAPLAVACQERFVSRGIPVTLDITPNLPRVCFNERALERILNNLLENAIRYGKPPFHLGLHQKGKAVCLVVRDHGEGIPAQEIPHLLQPFTRRESSRGGPPGSGLGLAIVARIVDLHHGTLELRSPPEGGLEVTVRLPLPNDSPPDLTS